MRWYAGKETINNCFGRWSVKKSRFLLGTGTVVSRAIQRRHGTAQVAAGGSCTYTTSETAQRTGSKMSNEICRIFEGSDLQTDNGFEDWTREDGIDARQQEVSDINASDESERQSRLILEVIDEKVSESKLCG
jgi:hypothetical protein